MTASRFAGHDPSAGVDTHGLPWAGRDLTAPAFGDDAGQADAGLRAAIVAGDESAVLAALASARLIVPIVAHPEAVAGAADSAEAPVKPRTDMASVALTAPDGRRGLPAFTGLDTLTAWQSTARPVPVTAVDAARAAIDDNCDVILLDLGAQHSMVLRLSQIWALAEQRQWLPPHEDPIVGGALTALVGELQQLRSVEIETDSEPAPGVLRLALRLLPGLARTEITQVIEQVAGRLGGDPEVRIRIDGVSITLRPDDPNATSLQGS